ncbi:hypothetical protein L208DRAFT_1297713 [Tricholoma matsutake]|nr:hypothetical protein L208DRAFT_1297713 [Tricholoma matsutake 945]
MPMPCSPNTPLFKGKHVNDFLDSLEMLASQALVNFSYLPSYVLRYSHRCVRDVIEFAPYWTQQDWHAAHAYLNKLYGSINCNPRVTADKFHKWIKHHSCDETFKSVQDVNQYYHKFMAQVAVLLSMQFITSKEADLLFFRGIP